MYHNVCIIINTIVVFLTFKSGDVISMFLTVSSRKTVSQDLSEHFQHPMMPSLTKMKCFPLIAPTWHPCINLEHILCILQGCISSLDHKHGVVLHGHLLWCAVQYIHWSGARICQPYVHVHSKPPGA